MALTPINEIRRRELISAAREVLETQGVAGATLERVAEKAGASKGIVLHYFGTKQRLLVYVLRHSNAALRAEVVRRMRLATTAEERLWAIISANFSPEFFNALGGQAWLALCNEVPREPEFKRLQLVFHARMHSNLVSALKQLLSRDEIEEFAIGLSSLIDGLWLRIATNSGSISRAVALEIMAKAIRSRLGSFAPPNDDAWTSDSRAQRGYSR